MSLPAATVRLLWNPNVATDQVTGYNAYEFIGTNWVKVGSTVATSITFSNVTQGVHTYSVTATNITGESPRSNSASTNVPPNLPTAPTFLQLEMQVSASDSLNGPWTNIAKFVMPPVQAPRPDWFAIKP